MLKVTVELVQWGIGPPQKIGTMIIANDGTGTRDKGNYQYRIDLKQKENWRSGRVEGYSRKRYNVWYLLKLILEDAIK